MDSKSKHKAAAAAARKSVIIKAESVASASTSPGVVPPASHTRPTVKPAKRARRKLSEHSSSSDEIEGPQQRVVSAVDHHGGGSSLGFYSAGGSDAFGNESVEMDPKDHQSRPVARTSRKRSAEHANMPTASAPSDEASQAKQPRHNLNQRNVALVAPNVERMMSKMGYKAGAGLGRLEDGIREPIEAKANAARSGIGFSLPGLEPGRVDWNFEAEKIEIQEKIKWISAPPPHASSSSTWTLEQLLAWRSIGEENLDISTCADFCDVDVLAAILASKDTLDQMNERDFGRARYRSNPFETIGKAIFMNRAAVKMANLDAILGFQLTGWNPSSMQGPREHVGDELFYFADVCAGPGGFSEYVLHRRGWHAKGFGFTLKGDCDFKLHDFVAGTVETFEPCYGVHDDGNIFDPDNVASFIDYVLGTATEGRGVHLVMADGDEQIEESDLESHTDTDLSSSTSECHASKSNRDIMETLLYDFKGFSVDGQENIQEILSKALYLSQVYVALAILREGGNFICKLFDIFTPFSVGLIYLLRSCFDRVAIHKPNTSRPANSERYVLCMGRGSLPVVQPIVKYLFDTHELMWRLSRDPKTVAPKKDVMELVPLSTLLNDEPFHSYIYESNNQLGRRQIQNLQKIVAFYRDHSLIETRQHKTRLDCLEFWKLPNERKRRADYGNRFDRYGGGGEPPPVSPESKFDELIGSGDGRPFLRQGDTGLTASNMTTTFRSRSDWVAFPVAGDAHRSKRGFYLGLGGTKVFRYNNGSSRWDPIVDIRMELPKDTLIYGEIVDEVYDLSRPSSCRRPAFHIIDAMCLGADPIGSFGYWERARICALFAKALNKPQIKTLAAIRVKQPIQLGNLHRDLLGGLIGRAPGSKIYVPVDSDLNEDSPSSSSSINQFLMGGLLFLKLSTDLWMLARSKSTGQLYYFNTMTRVSCFEEPRGAYADFKSAMSKRVIWWFDSHTNFCISESEHISTKSDKVHVGPFLKFIQSLPA